MGKKAGQIRYYSPSENKSKNVLPKENNRLCCCLVGDSGDCKESFSSAYKTTIRFLLKDKRPLGTIFLY